MSWQYQGVFSERLTRAQKPVNQVFAEESQKGDLWNWRLPEQIPCLANFKLGNPRELPSKQLVTTLQKNLEPKNYSWYGYKLNTLDACAVVAAHLNKKVQLSINWTAENIHLTTGAMAGLQIVFDSISNPGDEIIFISPPWPGYESMTLAAGATPIRVNLNPPNFILNTEAISSVLSAKTKALILNNPHNPSGRLFSAQELKSLANILLKHQEAFGKPLFLICDEVYREVVFDGLKFQSMAQFYPNSIIVYTLSKVLLMPGQRIGYLAINPEMDSNLRNTLRSMIDFACQLQWAYPNALLQHALPELLSMSIDIKHMEEKRNVLASILKAVGYPVCLPQASFYMLVESPIPDGIGFAKLLKKHGVLVLPGEAFGCPGYFRLSLTASMQEIQASKSGFEAALQESRLHLKAKL